jgi:O-antigen ligase
MWETSYFCQQGLLKLAANALVAVAGRPWKFPGASIAVATASIAAGFALFAFDVTPLRILCIAGGIAAAIALLIYPELALALYVVVGDIKGDERVASLFPVDLTIAMAVLLLGGIALNLLRRERVVPMPPVYFLFLALVSMMFASLAYTPVPEAGVEKLGRFLTVTGIVIVAPFFVLGTPQALKRFFAGFSVMAFAICAYSLTGLGGSERLATPTNNTIGLGHLACALIILIWFAVVPRFSFPKRMLTYSLLIVPGLALVGSGSRGPAVALGIVVLASLLFYRRLLIDVGCLLAIGLLALPFANIPDSSLEYMGSLIRSRSVSGLLSFRGDLLDYGWKLLQQHPLIGAGIEGFRYYSPNAGVYKWPHNIFLEVACELGIPAALLVCVLFGAAFRSAFIQLSDKDSLHLMLSQIASALLLIGVVNAMNTGDINSDRSTWLFVSLVFVVQELRRNAGSSAPIRVNSLHPVTA